MRIPNKSPLFDPRVGTARSHGEGRAAPGELVPPPADPGHDACEIARLPGRTPLIFIEVPGTEDTVLLYGHLDKQPEFTGWHEVLGPWDPVIRDGRLYGRGAADDGYAVFSSLTAIAALEAQHVPHARCVVLIEACEESGSPDLPAHVEALARANRHAKPVVCLDAEARRLRALVAHHLAARKHRRYAGRSDAHRGRALGSGQRHRGLLFRCAAAAPLARSPMNRTGELQLDELQGAGSRGAPPANRRYRRAAREAPWPRACRSLPAVQPLSTEPFDLLLNSTWKPTLTVTGIDGLPNVRNAGNVLAPRITVKFSFRLPPTANAARPPPPFAALSNPILRTRPHVLHSGADSVGWNAPPLEPWLERAVAGSLAQLSSAAKACRWASGGTIPFMAMLGEHFPHTQFLVTGVLGPHSNAHGPNEFLHIDYAKRLTAGVAQVIARHAAR